MKIPERISYGLEVKSALDIPQPLR